MVERGLFGVVEVGGAQEVGDLAGHVEADRHLGVGPGRGVLAGVGGVVDGGTCRTRSGTRSAGLCLDLGKAGAGTGQAFAHRRYPLPGHDDAGRHGDGR